ncbi:MAG: 30S ribosomal protein S12 methylthiotransferase RimO [candidate division Zixibacteria bacterium]|nr:30S ribosomal protein S12 methylthiotransferase RimO [candidate division Zixibacteria bacterium]
MRTKTYYFLNLGCPKNQVDGDYLRAVLNENRFREIDVPSDADFIIVNTCAFIKQARLESKGEIAELAELKKENAKIIATGCYPVLGDVRREIPQVDAAFAFDRHHELLSYLTGGNNYYWNRERLDRINPQTAFGYVKISDGCDNRCSYCAIPAIRGAYLSIGPEKIVAEVESLAEYGVKEIILVAQDSAIYGNDLNPKIDLADLCRLISPVDGIEWIRIMYAHPAHLATDKLEKIFSIDKVCRYLDLPIQHISDQILRSMNRHSCSRSIKNIINFLRNFDNELSLRTTLMVGFPGESDDDFKKLLDFVEETQFDFVGAFCYSPEPNTAAVLMDQQVDPELAQERYELLIDVAERCSAQRASKMIGKKQKMLIDGLAADNVSYFEARSFRQAPEIDGCYHIPVVAGVKPGMLVEVLTTDVDQGVI